MSKAKNRNMMKAIYKRMGIDPKGKATEVAMSNLKNLLVKCQKSSQTKNLRNY